MRSPSKVKKLARLVIKVQASEIEALLARGIEVDSLYRGRKEALRLPRKVIASAHVEEDLRHNQSKTPAFGSQGEILSAWVTWCGRRLSFVSQILQALGLLSAGEYVLDFLDVQEAHDKI